MNILPFDYDGNLKEYAKEEIEALADGIDFSRL